MATSTSIVPTSEQINATRREIVQLREKLEAKPTDTPLAAVATTKGVARTNIALRSRRLLRGHFGKIYSADWASDSRHIVSASQDGKLIVWNAFTTNKVAAIPLRSNWVMTTSFSPNMQHVASGGLDNCVSVWRLPQAGAAATAGAASSPVGHKLVAELQQHEGYVSCARWLNDREILSSSGDQSIIQWDVETKAATRVFLGHTGDVMSVRPSPINPAMFISGSTDSHARLWDSRLAHGNACVQTFMGHESDINTVSYMNDGNAFATGSDDSTLRLWDLRAQAQLNCYTNDRILSGVTSLSFSHSGRALFASYDDASAGVVVWDTQLGVIVDQLRGHDERVASVGVSPDGKALFTASWDTRVQIWA